MASEKGKRSVSVVRPIRPGEGAVWDRFAASALAGVSHCVEMTEGECAEWAAKAADRLMEQRARRKGTL